MCFSATASFTASVVLAGIGAASLRGASGRAERAYAAIPVLFAVQQLSEGLVWMSFAWDAPTLRAVATQVFSVFSHVLWPVYIPLAAYLIEPPGMRRRGLAILAVAGAVVGLGLLAGMLAFPISAHATGGHIEYRSPHFYIPVVITLYLASTTVSMLVSSHRAVQLFGGATLLAAVVAYFFYARWFISVWCFFAALLSVLVYIRIVGERARDPRRSLLPRRGTSAL